MNIGESIAQTVVREVREETGLEIEPQYITGVYSAPQHVIAFSDGEVRQQFSICFFCTITGGKISASNESHEVAFFSIQEIEQLRMHSSIRLRIQQYLKHNMQSAFS